MSAVQITTIESKTTQKGKSYKRVQMSDGVWSSCWAKIDGLAQGAWGVPTYETEGDFKNLVGFAVTMPAGAAPEYAQPETKKTAPTDQAVWDAKDRTMACESAYKSAAPIVASMVSAGLLTTEADVLRALDGLSLTMYEAFMLARQDRIASKANPFATE